MTVDLKVTDYDVRDLFITINDLDDQYARSINSFMCTDFCICPGTPADDWVKEYAELPDDLYAKYKRTKVGYNGKINLEDFSDSSKPKPLFWTYDPSTQKSKDSLVKLSSESFMDCVNNVDKIVESYKAEKAAGVSEASASDLQFKSAGSDVS